MSLFMFTVGVLQIFGSVFAWAFTPYATQIIERLDKRP